MGLTDRSRLGSIKSRQERLQRKLDKVNGKVRSAPASDSENVSVSEQDLSSQKKAWEKYMFAKAVYEETREMEHWQFMQQCISEYEKTLKIQSGIKVS